MIRKKKAKLKRRLVVIRRKIKRFNLKKARRWFKNNFKQHPFILGFLCILWINKLVVSYAFKKWKPIGILGFYLIILGSWFALVLLSNLLRDRERVRWYLKKRFVFFMLCFIKPFGLILLWSGARFKRITKILFTIIFGLLFVTEIIHYGKDYDKIFKESSFDRIVAMISKPKKKTFLKTLNYDVLSKLQFSKIVSQSRAKLAISDIAERCLPAIVEIKTQDRNGKDIGGGSGFVVSENGVIVTNFHVIESAYQAEVKVGEAVFKEVFLVKGLPALDIAVLKINSTNLPILSIGNSDSIINGQTVIVLGNPMGLERSISSGLVSAVRSKGAMKLIQMTAPVSPGSSGGPVINEYGEVIGITTLTYLFIAQNINFAVPINYLDKVNQKKN